MGKKVWPNFFQVGGELGWVRDKDKDKWGNQNMATPVPFKLWRATLLFWDFLNSLISSHHCTH